MEEKSKILIETILELMRKPEWNWSAVDFALLEGSLSLLDEYDRIMGVYQVDKGVETIASSGRAIRIIYDSWAVADALGLIIAKMGIEYRVVSIEGTGFMSVRPARRLERHDLDSLMERMWKP
jgi:hypothetical protein